MNASHSSRTVGAAAIFIAAAAAFAPAQQLTPAAQDAAQRPEGLPLEHPRLLPGGHFRADRIIVKLRNGQPVRAAGGVLDDRGSGAMRISRASLDALQRDGARWKHAYEAVPEATLDELRRNAEHTLGRAIPDQNLVFILDLGERTNAIDAVRLVSALGPVEWAMFDSMPAPLPSGPTGSVPSFIANQGYRLPAPNGVGATQVTTRPGGTGAGVAVVDIEYSWNLTHKDLPSGVVVIGGPGADPFNDPNHGTAVLGELASTPNAFGTTGIAPDASVLVAPANYSNGYALASAILQSVAALDPGDVILIEQQTFGPRYTGTPPGTQFGLMPSEWRRDVYDATVFAVGNLITVVAAAGNGSQNLDDPIYAQGNGGHWPFLPQNDSGAIIVGAGSAGGRSALWFTNYGATVDLQGWGESVMTTGYGNAFSTFGPDLFYTSNFGGTSGASPIVAGSAVLLQAMVKAETGGILTPAQIKQFLRNNGTPQNGAQQIGPLPNVLAAVSAALGQSLPPPDPFTLTSPANGAASVPVPVSVTWASSAGATTYRLVVDDNADFSSPIIDNPSLVSPSFQISQALTPPLTTFYWKVTANGIGGTTPSTPASASFTTAAIQPAPFALTTPADGEFINTITPTLTWQPSNGAQAYRLRLSRTLDLLDPVIDVSGLGTTQLAVSPGLLTNATRYYWSVSATNIAGTTVASPAVASFAVVLSPCLGDANGDRSINFADITAVLSNWTFMVPAFGFGDANGDGKVDFVDITTVLGSFNQNCP